MAAPTIALITGASKGIGFEIARQLGQQGLTVLIGARDQKKADEAAEKLKAEGLQAHGVQLEVTDPKHAQAAAKFIEATFGKLDVLVNNAGIGPEFVTPVKPSEVPLEVVQNTFNSNTMGPIIMIQAMLPLLRKSGSARIINQSSTLGSLGELSDPKSGYYGVVLLGYNASKTALNGVTLAFAKELAADKISVNSTCPGWVVTDMGGAGAPRTVQQGAAIAVKLATMDNPPTGQFLNDAGVIPW